ncbi:MAG: hypothetical protein EPN48_09160 [Microbacteriaceae bacterium]|nr:MAG: hypothetical protein EPN48_09160 [Microbacteriaceae bacterium]
MAHPLILTRDAVAAGRRSDIYRAHAAGELSRVRHGVYGRPGELSGTDVKRDSLYRTQVEAVLATRRAPVVTSVSATTLLGLPLLGKVPDVVYLLAAGTSGRRRRGVVELVRRGREEIVEVDGQLMTSIPQSVVQACRHTAFISGLAIVENAIRTDRFGRFAPLVTLDELWACYESLLPFPRSVRVRAVLTYATELAETPLETLSRVAIDELGFPQPAQQHELWLPRIRQRAFLDFAWPEYKVAGEADGWGKYVDPRYRNGLSPMDLVKREKRRDDAIRAVHWTPAHWDWNEAYDRLVLRSILLEAGLPRTRRARSISFG